MPLKKLSEPYRYPHSCKDPEHNPPNMVVLDPGTYEMELSKMRTEANTHSYK